jgi:hypothetical protein
VTNQAGDTVSFLVNKGGAPGTFAPAVNVPVDPQPGSLVLLDIDLDAEEKTGFADLDVAMLAFVDGKPIVSVLRNDTDGGMPGAPLALAPDDSILVDASAIVLLAGDVDGTNGEDLVTVNTSGAGGSLAGGTKSIGSVTVLLNSSAPSCLANISPYGDLFVDVDDLLLVINSWGDCESCNADVSPPGPPPGDGVVDCDDLMAIINAWGYCP